jgi:caffeoyl-CoA O-methyltransferase
MSTKTLGLSDELHQYLVAHGSQPDDLVADLIAETREKMGAAARMQIAPEQAAFLHLLAKIVGVRNAVEVGTFTGLSSLAVARAMPDDGRMTCFDISDEYTQVARRYWQRAGVADRIELRLGPADQRLTELPAEPDIDMAFIDADKAGYPTYWAQLVPRMRPGGVIVVDNVLWHGAVLDPQSDDDRAIVDFNDMVMADQRVEAVMLPIADGLTVARRRW